jgi:hypothetical protein
MKRIYRIHRAEKCPMSAVYSITSDSGSDDLRDFLRRQNGKK